MCENRSSCAFFAAWQVPQVATTVELFRLPRSEVACMTVWQSVQATLRDSCVLPFHSVRAVFSWQLRQIALRSAAGVGDLRLNEMPGFSSPPESTCFLLGPWQDSQPYLANAFLELSVISLPIGVAANCSTDFL